MAAMLAKTETSRVVARAASVLAVLGALTVFAAGQAVSFEREGPRAAKDRLEGRPPPALEVRDWRNTQGVGLTLAELKGKVVVIDFWGTWCGPCRASIPHVKKLLDEYADAGLVFIGVHTTKGGANLTTFLEQNGVTWPVAQDRDNLTVKAFAVDGYPDYYLIDRAGNLRVADLKNNDLERAVKALIAEDLPVFTRLERVQRMNQTWPDSTFAVRAGGERIGKARLLNRLVHHVDGPYYELIDDISLKLPEDHFVVRRMAACRLDETLTPFQAMAQGLMQGVRIDYHLAIEKGKVTGRVGIDDVLRVVPAPFTLDPLVPRIASLLDFEEGAQLLFQTIGVNGSLEVRRDERLDYVGETVVRIAEGDERPAHEVVYRDERRKVRATYWFDRYRRLLKVATTFPKLGAVEWLLEPPGAGSEQGDRR